MIPQKYRNHVGTKITCGGCLFARTVSLDSQEYEVLGIRWADCTILNHDTQVENPAYQLLLKNNKMKRSRWSRPSKIPEIQIVKGEYIDVTRTL